MTRNTQNRFERLSIWAVTLTITFFAWLISQGAPWWLTWAGWTCSILSVGAAMLVYNSPRRWIAETALKASKLFLRLAEYLESFDYPAK